ncbi:uncharacterized protein [Clytia hemisphaerica]|uniref:uncharacterized protein n=1 Tax=Clytia hemisphaerica TaxID=252671 RepID=UPI0034D3CD9F
MSDRENYVTDSEESDEELEPYKFEPSASEGESTQWDDSESSESEDDNPATKYVRKDPEEWCKKCGYCCIIDHPSFTAVCLNKDVLTWRYAGYRQFAWWVHKRLGKHIRRVIPSCTICRIRAEFEDPNANYTQFEGEDADAEWF